MRRPPRNSDGTIRHANRTKRLTNRSLTARWVETETLHLKRLGMGYQAIADHIVGVAHGQQKALVPVHEGVIFSEGYSISAQAVHRAFRRALVRLPNAEAAELRKLDSERLEDMLLSLQPGIRQGDPRSVEVAVKVLAHKAEINGYKAPARVEMSGSRVDVIVQQAADAQALADLSHLTVEELREYRRLEAKSHGAHEVVNSTSTAPEESAEPARVKEEGARSE